MLVTQLESYRRRDYQFLTNISVYRRLYFPVHKVRILPDPSVYAAPIESPPFSRLAGVLKSSACCLLTCHRPHRVACRCSHRVLMYARISPVCRAKKIDPTKNDGVSRQTAGDCTGGLRGLSSFVSTALMSLPHHQNYMTGRCRTVGNGRGIKPYCQTCAISHFPSSFDPGWKEL